MRCRKSGMLRRILRAVVLACSIGSVAVALAGPTDAPLGSVVGIRVELSDGDTIEGMGVYVGDGRVWTAAHVVSEVAAGERFAVLVAGPDGLYGQRVDGLVDRVDARYDAAVIRVANPGQLTPLPPCAAPAVGDRVHLVRLVPLDEPSPDEPLFTLELEERAFVAGSGAPAPALPGMVESGDSGGPVLSGDGRCFFGIVSGSLVHTAHLRGAIHRLAQVVLIDPAVFGALR